MDSNDFFGFIGFVAIVCGLAIFGGCVANSFRDHGCKNGMPQLIDAKVYRCVEVSK